MSTWYMLLDPRFAVHPGPGRLIGGAMGSAAGRKSFSIVKMVKSWIARQAAIRALEALDNRLLSDIGVSQFEIAAIVDGARTSANIHRFAPLKAKATPRVDDEVLAA